MKISKTAQAFLASGIFIVVAASLLMAYFKEGQEQSRLSQELSAIQILLAKQWEKLSSEEFSSQQSRLERRLALAESKLNTAKASLRQPIESIEITDTLFEIAETNEVEIVAITKVEIVEMNPPGWLEEDQEEVNFSAMSLETKIMGDIPNLVAFISEVSQQFPTSVNAVTEIDVEELSATSTLYIYTYEGD